MIDALMLFGSAARGDVDDNSDVDLLAVSDVKRPFSRKINGVEMQFIGVPDLMAMGNAGELFALHLAHEGKVIFDYSGCLAEFKRSVVPKECYEEERQKAFDLAWYLHDFGGRYDPELTNKRIAWCVRTVVISYLVERREFIFSPLVLSERFPHHCVPFLIGLRRSSLRSRVRMKRLNVFLTAYSSERPCDIDRESFWRHFRDTGNSVGVSTLLKLEGKQDAESVSY